MTRVKINLLGDIYPRSEPQKTYFIHSFWGWGSVLCCVSGMSSLPEKLSIFYLLILLLDKMKKKNGITESLTSPVEFENGAVRQGN